MQTESILIQSGLSEEQAIVYQALLEKGPQKAGPLSSWTGIKRGLMYKVLEQLENLGLVSKKGGTGTVTVYSPNHPSELLHMMEAREREAAMARDTVAANLGTFLSQFNLNNEKPNIQFYEGKSGIKKVLDDSLSSRGMIYTYVDVEAVMDHFADINADYVKRREAKNIPKKILAADTERSRAYYAEHADQLTDFHFVGSSKIPFGAAMQIYDDKISYITIGTDANVLIGVIIQDLRIASMHKYFFECLYELADKKTP